MAEDNENESQDPRSLYSQFVELATSRGLEDEDLDDFVAMKMSRAGFAKGPGDWVSNDESNGPKDDDNQPMTRGDYRRIAAENKQKNARQLPKKEPTTKTSKSSKDPWWQ